MPLNSDEYNLSLRFWDVLDIHICYLVTSGRPQKVCNYGDANHDPLKVSQRSMTSTASYVNFRYREPPMCGPAGSTATHRDQHPPTGAHSLGAQHPENPFLGPSRHRLRKAAKWAPIRRARSRAVGRQRSSGGPPSGLQPAHLSRPGPPQPPRGRGSADSLLSEAAVPPPSPGPSYLPCPRG